ncbi:nucleotide cyclase [Chloropicon primus]|nr:nucleotide cyclase [Chloropicon primus]
MEVADLGEELFRGATLQSGGERGLSRSESGSGPEASLALEGEGGARRPFAEALEALNPEEEKTFNKHTWWPGLVFKTWRMERVYLDGHARLSKKVVYAGYAGVFVAILILNGLVIYLVLKEQFESQPEAKKYFIGRTLTTLYCLLGTLGVGVLAHFFIHRSTQVSEKSWATLSALVVAMALVSALFVTFISSEAPLPEVAAYPYVFLRYIIVIFPIFLVVESFGLYVLLCLFSMSLFFGLYPTASRTLEQGCSQDPDCVVSTSTFALRFSLFENSYYALVWIVLTLCGSLVQEIKGRKQFFARVILVEQQEEIIRYKTQNTKLQKDLLNRMLPSTIVQQLEEENFVIQSQKQLENLSQHHSGVCIAFAELEGFATFSSQVHPSSVLNYLDDLFLVFDGLCDDHEVYKVETVGDQYVAAVGVVTGKMHNERVSVNSAARPENECNGELRDVSVFNTDLMISFAKAIMKGSRCVEAPEADVKPVLRIGIHTGPCMSGIVGTKTFRFCLFGDAMNTSARMVQTGPAGCIHTTQDVVGLVPDEPWEKLKKMEVKGKGWMQTYLLRCGSGHVDSSNQSLDVPSSPLVQYDNPLFFPSDHSMTTTSGSGRYIDVDPVSELVYSEHTRWFGFFFKRWHIERAYWNAQATKDKFAVLFGYALFVLLLLANLLFGYLYARLQLSTCAQNEEAWLEDWCEIVKEKFWATVSAFLIYTGLLITMISASGYGIEYLKDDVSNYWVPSMFVTIATLSSLVFFFSGLPLISQAFWFLLALGLYWGLGIPRIASDEQVYKELQEQNIKTGIGTVIFNFYMFASLITVYSIVLLCASFLRGTQDRKRFLQSLLSAFYWQQIIEEKSKNEQTQREFLENILPSSIVEEVQQPHVQTRSLSQRHFGVSILYADLVGFTGFCRRVDPERVFIFLNDLFVTFDQLCDDFNVYKVETVGDCYVATVGVVTGNCEIDAESHGRAENTIDMIGFAKAMVWGSREVTKPVVNTPATLRVGVHTGSCISGVIGTKVPKFSIMGDDVALAVLMEKKGKADHIHASESVVALVPDEAWEKHTIVVDSADGRERVVETFLLSV